MKHTFPLATKVNIKYSKSRFPAEYPAGTKVELYFDGNSTTYAFFDKDGVTRPLRISNLHKYFGTQFKKCPSVASLSRMSDEGYCTTVNGEKTEPDGFDKYGAPSWLLVVGVI